VKRWLRRNVWALVALPVVIVALGLPEINDLYHRYVTGRFREAVEVAKGAQGTYGDGRVTLVDITKVTPTTYGGDPIEVPSGYVFWKAVLSFDLKAANSLGGCKIFLEDGEGRRFTTSVKQLGDSKLRSSDGCADYSSLDGEKTSFTSDLYFLLPPGAEPAAIRIERGTLMPRYLLLHTS
jgi:hypothetical protein